MKRFQLKVLVLSAVCAACFSQFAQAHPYVSFGIRVGVPICPGPYYYGYGPYYYGYPYYYGPRAVIVEAAPAPLVVAPGVVPALPPPPPYSAPLPAPSPQAAAPAPAVIPTASVAQADPQTDPLVRKLSDPNESVRHDAALDLGRMKANRAVETLMQVMAKDQSPVVRDGAARALGLIAAPRSLNALIFTAQADTDREVRHSAQFAVEVIRNNLRGN